MRVVVTQKDIDKARDEVRTGRRFALSCPVAQSLRRRVPKGVRVSVGPVKARFESADGFTEAMLPEKAQKFIHSFDNEYPVAPFSFDLALDPESVM